MKHIKQKNGSDCGIASAAMISGVSYQKALDAIGKIGKGLSVKTMQTLLSALTGLPWKVSKIKVPLQDARNIPRGPVALLVRRKDRTWGHWVAAENGVVYDPDFARPVARESYRRRGWVLLRVIYSP